MGQTNQIYDALFNLVSRGEKREGKICWGEGETLLYTSRRVRMFNNFPVKPALCQLEPTETVTKQVGVPGRHTLGAEWWVFYETSDPDAVPTIKANDIIDALKAIIAPPPYVTTNRQDLGVPDLVYDCRVEGTILKIAGDIEGEALLCLPITIVLP